MKTYKEFLEQVSGTDTPADNRKFDIAVKSIGKQKNLTPQQKINALSQAAKLRVNETEGDANPSVNGNPVVFRGKPMSMNQAEIKGLERLNKLKKENPKEYNRRTEK